MSNSFRGQTQYMQSPMGFGGMGYGDPYVSSGGGYGYGSSMGGYGGGYGSPFSSSLGGYGTTFGGMGMGGGYGGYGQQQSLVPQYQPTINDLFSQYFSQQYYGGQAFNPFAATSLFGGGYGGGFGGGGRGMGGRMRRRRQMFEDMFSPQQQPTAQPEPMPQPAVEPYSEPVSRPAVQPYSEPVSQPAVMPQSVPVQPQYFGGLPIDFGYSMPVASAQPAPYMPTYQSAPMSAEDVMLAREAIRSGAFSAL
jgi:hypothetical protein